MNFGRKKIIAWHEWETKHNELRAACAKCAGELKEHLQDKGRHLGYDNIDFNDKSPTRGRLAFDLTDDLVRILINFASEKLPLHKDFYEMRKQLKSDLRATIQKYGQGKLNAHQGYKSFFLNVVAILSGVGLLVIAGRSLYNCKLTLFHPNTATINLAESTCTKHLSPKSFKLQTKFKHNLSSSAKL